MTGLEARDLVVPLVAHGARGDQKAMCDLVCEMGAAEWSADDWFRLVAIMAHSFARHEAHHIAEHHGFDSDAVLASWPLREAAKE